MQIITNYCWKARFFQVKIFKYFKIKMIKKTKLAKLIKKLYLTTK